MSILEVQGLTKTFDKNTVLKDISLQIQKGEIHSLVGENGAGKSTLIKLVTGIYTPTSGEIHWLGKKTEISDPGTARHLGINVIHQDRHLIPHFTGYENLYLGLPYPRRKIGFGVDWPGMKKEAESLKERLGIELPLKKSTRDLSPPQKTMLEILRAMMLHCRLLILDEPTASLSDTETELLFRLIRRLKSEGTSVLYVSHYLDEVLDLSDRITVLRNGRRSATLKKGEADKDRLIHHMTDGQAKTDPIKKKAIRVKDDVLLKADHLQTKDLKVKNAGIRVNRKEIVGLFGLAGSGRTEFLEAIYGIRPVFSGTIEMDGRVLRSPSPRNSLKNGMVLIPEDRRAHSLIMGMTIRENMTLPLLSNYTEKGYILRSRENTAVAEWMKSLEIKAVDPEQQVRKLSGGNQQKVVFARALMSDPVLFLCDEPTQAVDVMTRNEIHHMLRNQADQGGGVLFVSSDLQEVIEVCDRLVVMQDGRTIAELEQDRMEAEKILQLCYR